MLVSWRHGRQHVYTCGVEGVENVSMMLDYRFYLYKYVAVGLYYTEEHN